MNVSFGTVDNLVQKYGGLVLGTTIGYLPHIIYSAHDNFKEKGHAAEHNIMAGSILGLSSTQFEAMITDGGDQGWLVQYQIHPVRYTKLTVRSSTLHLSYH